MTFWKPGLLTLTGSAFLLIGFVTALSAIGHARVAGDIPWLFVGYAGLNVLLGLGFYLREQWVLYAAGLNALGFTLLHLATLLSGVALDWPRASVNILLAFAVWGLVWSLRRHLIRGAWGYVQGAFFVGVWVAVYVYSFVNTLM